MNHKPQYCAFRRCLYKFHLCRMQRYTELPLLTIDGENTVEDGYWAYELDQDSLQQIILQLFYEEI